MNRLPLREVSQAKETETNLCPKPVDLRKLNASKQVVALQSLYKKSYPQNV